MSLKTSRTIVLGGPFGGPAITSLHVLCDQLRAEGVVELSVDMSGVTECERAGLDGLQTLASGPSDLAVSIQGARWEQFTTMLGTEPDGELPGLRESVRTLLKMAPTD